MVQVCPRAEPQIYSEIFLVEDVCVFDLLRASEAGCQERAFQLLGFVENH